MKHRPSLRLTSSFADARLVLMTLFSEYCSFAMIACQWRKHQHEGNTNGALGWWGWFRAAFNFLERSVHEKKCCWQHVTQYRQPACNTNTAVDQLTTPTVLWLMSYTSVWHAIVNASLLHPLNFEGMKTRGGVIMIHALRPTITPPMGTWGHQNGPPRFRERYNMLHGVSCSTIYH